MDEVTLEQVFFQDLLFPLLILVYQISIFILILIISLNGHLAKSGNLQTKQSSFSYLGALDRIVLSDFFLVFSRLNTHLFK